MATFKIACWLSTGSYILKREGVIDSFLHFKKRGGYRHGPTFLKGKGVERRAERLNREAGKDR